MRTETQTHFGPSSTLFVCDWVNRPLNSHDCILADSSREGVFDIGHVVLSYWYVSNGSLRVELLILSDISTHTSA